MARRKYRRTRYVYGRAKRAYHGRKGLLSGNIGDIVIGAVAGAAAPMIPQVLGPWTNPLLFGAGGYIFKKRGLLTIAGYEIGKTLTGGGLSANQSSGGGWL